MPSDKSFYSLNLTKMASNTNASNELCEAQRISLNSALEQQQTPTSSGQETNFEIGQNVLVRGTGKWWGGQHFQAIVTDIRESDQTIKVKYADGGYKRFPMADFQSIALPASAAPQGDTAFGTYTYELDVDQLYPQVGAHHIDSEVDSAILKMQTQLKEAIYRRDFEQAEKLKQQISQTIALTNDLKILSQKLKEAVAKEDYAGAHELQGKIDEIVAIQAQSQAISPSAASALASSNLASKLKELDKSTASLQQLAGTQSTGSSIPSNSSEEKKNADFWATLKKAGVRALGGGTAGAMAMALQVGSLMWMRTIMNYQYRYGTSFKQAASTLYKEGGIRRFYRGIAPALVQGPLSRFGDTASNVGMLALLENYEATAKLPVGLKTIAASAAAASFRIALMPVDTVKTIMQVEGAAGIPKLKAKFAAHGPSVFYHGALAASAATFAGHYPWFATYNYLDARLPVPTERLEKLARSALLGFSSSVVSDTVSNSIRVVKTYRQTHPQKISYQQAVRDVVKQDGVAGLFGRGLSTRIIANGAQGLMFSVLWKYFDEKIHSK